MKKAKLEKLRAISSETLIVGVDVGMTSNSCFCTTLNSGKGKGFSFSNTRVGFDDFLRKVFNIRRETGCKDVVIGIESTGPYGEPLVHYLSKKPVILVQINALHTKKTKEVCHNSRMKSDDKDPMVIADIIKLGRSLSMVIPEGEAAELRRLNKARDSYLKIRTMHINQLRQLVFSLFPEYRLVIKNMACKTSMHILQRYTTPENIKGLNPEQFGIELKKLSGGKLSYKKAKELIGYAGISVGVKHGQSSLVMHIRQVISLLEMYDRHIKELESKMKDNLSKIKESSYILSIRGIGLITAAGILGEIGDFSNFHNRLEILKFAGLNLCEQSSGVKKGQKRISKFGRSYLRKTLFFASLNMVRKSGFMHEYYKKLLERGMKRKKALIAVSRKLLCVINALVRDRRTFVENYSTTKTIKKAA